MHDDSVEGPNVILDYKQEVSMVRVLGRAVMPMRIKVKAEVIPNDTASEIDFDVTFAKVKFWFETIIARTIAICRNNADGLTMFTDSDGRLRTVNNLMITPFEPTDEHLAALFQSKMAALSGGKVTIGCVRVNSNSESGLVFTYVGNWTEDLPEMADWFSNKPYYFDAPWWTRDDISTLDMITAGTSDFNTRPNWAYTLDFIENAIRPREEQEMEEDAPAAAVIRGKFRPKVIDGGSRED